MTEISFDTEGVTDCPMNGKAKPGECFGCNYCKVGSGDLIARCIYEDVSPKQVDSIMDYPDRYSPGRPEPFCKPFE